MARNKLNDAFVRSDLKPGRYSDGGNLYLSVSKNRSKSWVFMYSRNKEPRHEMGLGSYPGLTLAEARKKAQVAHEILATGKDPLKELRKKVPTFEAMAKKFIEGQKSGWKNAKHIQQWENTLKTHCTLINKKRVNEITVSDVLAVLKPIWETTPETASRVRGRIERVLGAAKAKEYRSGENPAAWKDNLDHLLPSPKKLQRGNHKAMHYDDAPAFFTNLLGRKAVAAKALAFIVLTAARSQEALGAKWSEIDFLRQIWTCPAERMKAGQKHEVPLSGPALAILQEMKEASQGSDYIFPGEKPQNPISSTAIANLLKHRMKVTNVTVHGFRSTFRDWCGDKTEFPREVAEAALAHRVGNEVEQAYRRFAALEKRRRLMQAWANYLTGAKATRTVSFEEARKKLEELQG